MFSHPSRAYVYYPAGFGKVARRSAANTLKCRYTPMDAQSTTIMSVVLAIVIGYLTGRAIGA